MRIISRVHNDFEALGRERYSVLIGCAARVPERLARSFHMLADKLWNSRTQTLNFHLVCWDCEKHQFKNVNQESLS
jgi:hypothetical protein